MNKIELMSEVLVVESIDKTLQAKGFADLSPGDRFYITSTIENVGRNKKGASYAPVLTVHFVERRVGSSARIKKTYNQLSNILDKITFAEGLA